MSLNLQGTLGDFGNITAAVGALGTAASSLVDGTKAFSGGVSNIGFSFIEKAAAPFEDALNAANPPKGIETIRNNWLSGVAVADQLAAAKSLIKLGLTATTAPKVAAAMLNLDAKAFTQAVANASAGQTLNDHDKAVLQAFDDTVGVRLLAAIQRADQQYKNAAKAMASIFAIALSVLGVLITQGSSVNEQDLLIALIVGVIATPLAPVAKDLTTSLNTYVTALKGGGTVQKA